MFFRKKKKVIVEITNYEITCHITLTGQKFPIEAIFYVKGPFDNELDAKSHFMCMNFLGLRGGFSFFTDYRTKDTRYIGNVEKMYISKMTPIITTEVVYK